MTVAAQSYGYLSATQVTSGKTSDESFYLPLIARAREMLGRVGVFYVGDSKMAALAIRAQIAHQGDYYLTAEEIRAEIEKALPE